MIIVGQHIAGQRQQGFGSDTITVIDRPGHVVGDVDVERSRGGVAIAVAGDHGELFAEIVGAVAGRMGFVAVERVAVADNAGRRVVPGDGQRIAQLRGDRLREADGHATVDQVDAADAQAGQTVRCRYGEAATLRQRSAIGGRAVGQIGFVYVQLTAGDRKPAERDRIVHRWRRDNRRADIVAVVTIVDDCFAAFFGKLGNTVKPGSGETDNRIDPPADFLQQHKAVAATRFTRHTTCWGIRTCSGGFSGFTRVVTGGDGFLDLLDIGQLCIARGQRLSGVHLCRLAGQQLVGQGHIATAAQGQFLAVLQMNGNRALRPGDQLIAGKQAIPLNQGATSAVDALSENLTDNLGNCADERSHVKSSAADHRQHWFAKQPMAQSGCRGDARTLDSSFHRSYPSRKFQCFQTPPNPDRNYQPANAT